MLYGLDDITLIPAKITDIDSRAECDPFYHDYNDKGIFGKHLPLLAAPMSSVIDENNFNKFTNCGINAVVPRSVDIEKRISLCKHTFCAFGLDEIKTHFIDDTPLGFGKMSGFLNMYVCIDVANGHMLRVYSACRKLKDKYKDGISIMTGNIANPDTYAYICDRYEGAVDYIRVGIGGGSCCTTSANAAIHYPMASLIEGCYTVRVDRGNNNVVCPYIVADGGFDSFDKIIKALALGADYVMLGYVLAKSEEACGKIISEEYVDGWRRFRYYYGMSTKKAQKEMGKEELKTAEGIERKVNIEYPIAKWVDNFTSYLRSAMSYMDARSILDFIGSVCYDKISPNAFKSFYK